MKGSRQNSILSMMASLAGLSVALAIYILKGPSSSPSKYTIVDMKLGAAVVPESHIKELDAVLKNSNASQPEEAVISEAEKQRIFKEGQVALTKFKELLAQWTALKNDTDETVRAVHQWSLKFEAKAQGLTDALTPVDSSYETAHENEKLWVRQHQARAPQAMWDWLHSDERVGDLPIREMLVAVMDYQEYREAMLRYVSGSSAYTKAFAGVNSKEAFLSALEKTSAASQSEYAKVSAALPAGLRMAYHAQSDASFSSQIKQWYNSCLTQDQVEVHRDMIAQFERLKRCISELPGDTAELSILMEGYSSIVSPSPKREQTTNSH